jgi:hypothetical protein
VNQNPFPRTLKIALNASLGLTGGKQFVLTEIYPGDGDRPIPEQPLPAAAWDDELTFHLPAHSVRSSTGGPRAPGRTTIVFLNSPLPIQPGLPRCQPN